MSGPDIAKIAAGQEEPVLNLTRELREQITKEAGAQFKMSVLLKCVQAAIEAQGLAVVPVEPTEGMVRAGRDAENDAQNSPFWLPPEQIALMVYAAMLAASPLRGEG